MKQIKAFFTTGCEPWELADTGEGGSSQHGRVKKLCNIFMEKGSITLK